MSTFGDKLKEIRELKNLTQDQLAKKLGVEKQHVSNWERNKNQPGKENLDKLMDVLGISASQLLGKNNENSTPALNTSKIPFYDAVAVGGVSLLAEQETVYKSNGAEMIDPGTWFRSASGALRVYGHSMFPKYPAGCIIAFKDSDKDVLIWGEDYVIELQDRRIIKRIEKSKQDGYICAVSYNKSTEYVYATIELPITKIKRIFMVLGKVELEASI